MALIHRYNDRYAKTHEDVINLEERRDRRRQAVGDTKSGCQQLCCGFVGAPNQILGKGSQRIWQEDLERKPSLRLPARSAQLRLRRQSVNAPGNTMPARLM